MKRLLHALLTAILLCLVVLVYLGGITRLRPVYDALRHIRRRAER